MISLSLMAVISVGTANGKLTNTLLAHYTPTLSPSQLCNPCSINISYILIISMNDASGLQVNSEPWLEHLLKSKCGFTSVREFQLKHGMDLINGKHVFLVIVPDQGKTTVLLAPLLAAKE